MTLGNTRFEYYLIQLDELLLAASKTDNAALYLYKNDCRTKVFMLEGLAKLYAGLHNEKKFLKLKERFKLLEDALGAIDYYDAFAKQFKASRKIPATIKDWLAKKVVEKQAALNAILINGKWINHDPLRVQKVSKKLTKMKWLSPEEEINAIKKFYLKSIENIVEFYTEVGNPFTDIEAQVHELRRKLRWLSIYPQALQGAIQLVDSKVADKNVKKYLIPEIVKSPFNVMPKVGDNKVTLKLEKNYFLALSNMIQSLGTIKDSGLKIMVLQEAIKATKKVTDATANKNALLLSSNKPDALKKIMDSASALCKVYFEEGNLKKLL
jgi:hypothetical protein